MTGQDGFPLVSYQPLRIIFQLCYAASVIPRIPYYLALSFLPGWRPNPSWSAKQTFMSRLTWAILDMTSRVAITEPLTLKEKKEGSRFRTVSPSKLPVYEGPLASQTVKPATIGGTWFPDAPGSDIASKTVVYYVHGGAFIAGDGRTDTCGVLASRFWKAGSGDIVFSLQYRLSGHGDEQAPFPAALQDAVSGYLYLLNELKIPASQIVLAGDSSGGNLAAALLRYLSEFGAKIDVPTPKCALLLSPWVDPFYNDLSDNAHTNTDFVPVSYGIWGAYTYTKGMSNGKENPYVVPIGKPFKTPVPLFVNAGSAEIFFEKITQWAAEMREEGNEVELNIEEAAPHDTWLSAEILGFEKSAWEVADKAAKFAKKY